ncbi:putative chromosome segregation protein [Erysiphe necator]|uniref:Putative chromosome segregation protein n=1 Tax=Uncinula necator TaxID=52586 RepID=A0A0B1PFS1_UNCNE|nr:putative chromosome segregation protein [Erysiphe necator]
MPTSQQVPLQLKSRQKNNLKPTESTLDVVENLIDLSFDSCSNKTDSNEFLNSVSKYAGPQIESQLCMNMKEEQQTLITDQIENERQKLQKEINLRRDARRKSLANRRVSFAPEATLHTWDVLVEYQDSTTSTNSTSSTKKAQSLSSITMTSSDSQTVGSIDVSATKTSIMQGGIQGSMAVSDLVDLNNSYQTLKKNSEIAQLESNSLDNEEDLSSSCSVDSTDGADDEDDGDINDDAAYLDSDSGDDRTFMTSNSGETTNFSITSKRSRESNNSSLELNEALRQAAYQAGTRGIEYDENFDTSKFEEMEKVIPSSSWLKKNSPKGVDLHFKIEKAEPSLQLSKSSSQKLLKYGEEKSIFEISPLVETTPVRKQIEDGDNSMDVTHALNRIVNNEVSHPKPRGPISTGSLYTKLEETVTSNASDDDMMDITVAHGGIQSPQEINDKFEVDNVISSHDVNSIRYKGQLVNFNQKHVIKGRKSFYTTLGEDQMDITTALGGIIKPVDSDPDTATDTTAAMDVTTALGGIIKSVDSDPDTATDTTAAMDVTTALGGIIKSVDSDPDTATDTTAAMDVTTALGGIIKSVDSDPDTATDTTAAMDVTTALGGIIKSVDSDPDTATDTTAAMDVTTALGGIIKSVDSDPDTATDTTAAMDVTTALDGIIKSIGSDHDTITYVNTTLHPQVIDAKSHVHRTKQLGLKKKVILDNVNFSFNPDKNSPSPRTNTRRKTSQRNIDIGDSKILRQSQAKDGYSPMRKPQISPSHSTLSLAPPLTPRKSTSSGGNISCSSPQKKTLKSKTSVSTPLVISNEIPSTPKSNDLKGKNLGFSIPNLTLSSKSCHASGMGFNKLGLGSPRVADLLDRRDSIGNRANSFIPGEIISAPLATSLKDPRLIEQELSDEREAEAGNNQGNFQKIRSEITGKEKNATSNLKEMIESLTPKKTLSRNRKSLRVGAAVGLLGKRPVELDEIDDIDELEGTKRLKNHQGSPVKNIKLQAPPSKNQTTSGRAIQNLQNSAKNSSLGNVSPDKAPKSGENEPIVLEYKSLKRKYFQENLLSTDRKSKEPFGIEGKCSEDDRIQLQDFLNMTSIRFMELTTTKRRHTILPKANSQNNGTGEKQISWEDCVATGAATIPMLELFQHACHELKRYISEGRKTVREIETETWEENPPLFREYISATPDLKFLMDNQLKNVKTHSRLLSKGQWYDWRMTLHGTLKEGLAKSAEGMVCDEEILNHQQMLLDSVLPSAILNAKSLEEKINELQVAAQEIANCNKEELSAARQRLITVDENYEYKKIRLVELQKQLQKIETDIVEKHQYKQKLQKKIYDAEKIKEECRGWTVSEIQIIKRRVEVIEELFGWAITAISGSRISMTLLKEIRLVFNILFFSEKRQSKDDPTDIQIDLKYVGSTQKSNPLFIMTSAKFFVPCIQKYVRQEVMKKKCNLRGLLEFISKSWRKAAKIAQDIHLLALSCPTQVSEITETSMAIESSLLIGPLATKVVLTFYLSSKICNNDHNNVGKNQEVDFIIKTKANVVYGQRFNELKMAEFLLNRCGYDTVSTTKSLSWGEAVSELGEKLLARGRK